MSCVPVKHTPPWGFRHFSQGMHATYDLLLQSAATLEQAILYVRLVGSSRDSL